MRIRKRQVPFPLSSLSPVPLSDPLLNLNSPSPVVQLHHYDSSPPIPSNPSQPGHGLAFVHPQPSDRPNQHISPIGSRNNGWNVSDAGGEHKEEKKKKKEENCLVSSTATLLTNIFILFFFFFKYYLFRVFIFLILIYMVVQFC